MIYTIIGARPNILKVDAELPQTLVHTGQHFSDNMSEVFFEELKLEKPKYNLKCKGHEVGKMIDKLRVILRQDKPSLVIVFGDTNSSLAGALAARYEKIKVAHIEAGMRSHTDMPEETNRVIIDHIASVNFCANENAMANLSREGLNNMHLVGDPLVDTMMQFMPIERSKLYREYILVTIHREVNANQEWLQKFLDILGQTEELYIFPAHPRVKKFLKAPKNVKIISPVGYKKMLSLESNAKKIITDSGGVQREGAWMNIPTIVMREETEWVDLLSQGRLTLANLDNLKEKIETFKVPLCGAPMPGINKKIKEILVRYI